MASQAQQSRQAQPKGLAKKERGQIFRLFMRADRLRFSEIEKEMGIRSNMVAYHLEQLHKQGLLKKEGTFYSLTKEGERYIPIFPNVLGEGLSPLPVALVAIMRGKKMLLINRTKRPYKGYWSMIGGKMLIHETIEDACRRLARERAGLDIKFTRTNAVFHERVLNKGEVKHSFILFFATASAKSAQLRQGEQGEIMWADIKEAGRMKMIPSDIWLIKNKLDASIEMNEATMEEEDGELSSFHLTNHHANERGKKALLSREGKRIKSRQGSTL